MLEVVEIKNFRSCEDLSLPLGEPVIALLGKNGVGKTNLLHAIQLAAAWCVGAIESDFGPSPRERAKPTCFGLQFFIDGNHYEYRIERVSASVSNQKGSLTEFLKCNSQLLISREDESLESKDFGQSLRVGIQMSSLAALTQLLPEDHSVHKALMPVARYLRAVGYYPLSQGFQEHTEGWAPFIEISRYEKWKDRFVQGRPSDSVSLRLLHMHLTGSENLEELKSLLGNDGLGLITDIRIEEIQVVREKTPESEPAFSIQFVPGSGLAGAGRPFRFNGLSAGTLRVLRLLTYLVFDKSSCMLLEQPEDCIHPGLLAKVVDILRTYSGRTQLICTTHSPRVMDLVGAEGIRLVTADEGRTAVAKLTPSELNAAKSYRDNEGTLSEFLETL